MPGQDAALRLVVHRGGVRRLGQQPVVGAAPAQRVRGRVLVPGRVRQRGQGRDPAGANADAGATARAEP